WPVERFVGADHYLRVAINLDLRNRALGQESAPPGDLYIAFIIFNAVRNLKVEGQKAARVTARSLLQDNVAMVAFELDLGANVDASDRARCQWMRCPHPQSIPGARLCFSRRRHAERAHVRRDL